MLNPNTLVLLKCSIPGFSSPVQEIYACSSYGQYIILDDDNREVCFTRDDFYTNFPHLGQRILVSGTENHYADVDFISTITGIYFNKNYGRGSYHRYIYGYKNNGSEEYLTRNQFILL